MAFFEITATLFAALFSGAAIYIHVAEHPARMKLEAHAAAAQWAESYRRATWMQAPLALASLCAGLVAGYVTGEHAWWYAAILIGAVVPITLVMIMPVNKALLGDPRDSNADLTRSLLRRWNQLHAIRTTFGLAATLIFVWLLAAA